jgi:hypothetical protein
MLSVIMLNVVEPFFYFIIIDLLNIDFEVPGHFVNLLLCQMPKRRSVASTINKQVL